MVGDRDNVALVSLASGLGATSGAAFSSWMEYSGGVYTLYYVLANPSAGGFILGAGTLGDNGAVNGLTQTQFGTIWTSGDSYPCVYGTPTDVLVGIATSKSGAYQLEIYHIAASSKQVLSKVAMSTGPQPTGASRSASPRGTPSSTAPPRPLARSR